MKIDHYSEFADLDKIKAKVQEYIEQTEKKIAIINRVLPVLKAFDSKTCSKRIVTKVNEALPEYMVYYEDQYSSIKLRIWEKDYNKALTIYLLRYAGSRDKTFHYDTFISNATWIKVLPIYLEKYQNSLDHLEGFVSIYNNLVSGVKDLDKKLTEFDLQYIFD